VEDQVLVINAAVSGALDAVPLESVRECVAKILEYMDTVRPEFGRTIRETGDLPDDVRARLNGDTATFVSGYLSRKDGEDEEALEEEVGEG
jgi:F-type H+-transporting ATPase subunit alpha